MDFPFPLLVKILPSPFTTETLLLPIQHSSSQWVVMAQAIFCKKPTSGFIIIPLWTMGLLAATFAIFFSEISDDSSLSTSTAFLYTNFSSSFSFFSFLFCVPSSHQSSLEQDVLIKKYFGKVLRASSNSIKTRKNNKECTREKKKNQKIHTTLTFAIPLETSMSNDIVSLKYYK